MGVGDVEKWVGHGGGRIYCGWDVMNERIKTHSIKHGTPPPELPHFWGVISFVFLASVKVVKEVCTPQT